MDAIEITLWSIHVCSLALIIGLLVGSAMTIKQQGGVQ